MNHPPRSVPRPHVAPLPADLPGAAALAPTVEGDDVVGRAAPATANLLDPRVEDLLVLDLEVAPHGEVVEAQRPTRAHDVEARQVPAGCAAIPGDGHAAHFARCDTAPPPSAPQQRSFDDLGTPLSDVTFCVVDLETTGGSPNKCAITEIGAARFRGGVCGGTFQTLVNPGAPIPPEITILTGITEAMVLPAPRIDQVLPSFLEFLGDAVVVGHNVRFDLSFLRAALEATGRAPLSNRSVDTHALARRLVRDEVPNCKLGTLAERLRLDHRPSHRALDDVLATADLLHLLLERSGRLGVTALEDLLSLPTLAGHADAAKLRLTEHLPRTAGVYLFRDHRGEVLYVGKATNLRARVRSYFSTDSRRKISRLLREVARIDHVPCRSTLEAAALEVRLIHHHLPPYNRQAKTWRKYVYLKLTLDETFPRFSIVRAPRDDDALYLGPLSSRSAAKHVAEAVQTVLPLRRCTDRPTTAKREAPCAAAQLGVATCPCAGDVTPDDYAVIVKRAVEGLTNAPGLLFEPLVDRMVTLAVDQRFEEATDVRERARALAGALRRQRRLDMLRRAGSIELALDDGPVVHLAGGLVGRPSLDEPRQLDRPLPREQADEVSCVAAWLEANAERVRPLHVEGEWACPLPMIPSYEPREPGRDRR